MNLFWKKTIHFLKFVLILFPGSCLFLHCGQPSPMDFPSLLDKQPFVMESLPVNQSQLTDPVEFELRFSQKIDFDTIQPHSITLLTGPLPPELLKDSRKLSNEILDQELTDVPLNYFLSAEETQLTAVPRDELDPGVYYLVVTPQLKSTEGIPFNQIPGENPQVFIASFAYGEAFMPPSPWEDPLEAPPSYGPKPEILMIHEFLYDGAVSETDGEAFVELYGTPFADISLYEISFLNGANGEPTDRVTLPPGSVLNEAGFFVVADLKTGSRTETRVFPFDFLDQFDPQNGPDAIHLKDRNGQLVDALSYGEGGVEMTADGLPMGEGLPAADAPGGQSLSRLEGVDTDENSVDFSVLPTPSPGKF